MTQKDARNSKRQTNTQDRQSDSNAKDLDRKVDESQSQLPNDPNRPKQKASTAQEITLLVRDRQTQIVFQCSERVAEVVFAALSADPDSIEELYHSTHRFVSERNVKSWLNKNSTTVATTTEQSDSQEVAIPGIVVDYDIDLPARMISCRFSDDVFSSAGSIPYVTPNTDEQFQIDYRLALDWQIDIRQPDDRATAKIRKESRDAVLSNRQNDSLSRRHFFSDRKRAIVDDGRQDKWRVDV